MIAVRRKVNRVVLAPNDLRRVIKLFTKILLMAVLRVLLDVTLPGP